MFNKVFKRARAGQVIKAKTANELEKAAEQIGRLTARPPIGLMQVAGVPCIYWAGATINANYYLPTTGPIPAAKGNAGALTLGSGKAQRYYRDPQTNVLKAFGNTPDTIYNWAPAEAGDKDRLLICITIDGVPTIISEACPTS